jgi:hypothetical protein
MLSQPTFLSFLPPDRFLNHLPFPMAIAVLQHLPDVTWITSAASNYSPVLDYFHWELLSKAHLSHVKVPSVHPLHSIECVTH